MLSLDELNDAQRGAVVHDPSIPLQILAGPGSGKTKALTSRVAYLVQHHHLLPTEICAVTFTNKAAKEMKERLSRLIGEDQSKKLVMGTFHALCARFLRRWGTLINLKDNFSICDAEESKKMINKILKPLIAELTGNDVEITDNSVFSAISTAKSKNISPEEMALQLRQGRQPPDPKKLLIHQVYAEYQENLRRTNSLDFDDLLVYGVRLFERNATLSSWCRHVLVDEFQDTNPIQYRLMVLLAKSHRRLTIVGDPDQSIYGWRSADAENLAFMKRDFPTTMQIFLEQNYRSTASILELSLRIVSQDQDRVPKTLLASHHEGHKPLLCAFPDEQMEAEFIAKEILRLKAHTGGLVDFKDFAILLRFNALSRALEQALQREGIPVRLLGGHKFFERMEIKDIVAYLVLVDNPSFESAFVRAINNPSRQIGEKSVAQILRGAVAKSVSPLDLVIGIYEGRYPDIKPPVKRKLGQFVPVMLRVRSMVAREFAIADIIKYLIEAIEYEEHLKKSQKEWETRWENIQELINFAARFTPMADEPRENNNMLGAFLETCTLSQESPSEKNLTDPNSVTISTCHAAKGLEWPVVFVPAVEQNVYPFVRSDDKNEERRLLYVACTRAQAYLGLTYCAARMTAGEKSSRELSEFIRNAQTGSRNGQRLCSNESAYFSISSIEDTARILRRDAPDEATILKIRREFDQSKWGVLPMEDMDWNELELDSGLNEPLPVPVFESARAIPRPPATNHVVNRVEPVLNGEATRPAAQAIQTQPVPRQTVMLSQRVTSQPSATTQIVDRIPSSSIVTRQAAAPMMPTSHRVIMASQRTMVQAPLFAQRSQARRPEPIEIPSSPSRLPQKQRTPASYAPELPARSHPRPNAQKGSSSIIQAPRTETQASIGHPQTSPLALPEQVRPQLAVLTTGLQLSRQPLATVPHSLTSNVSEPQTKQPSQPIKLAAGTKRLGMGRMHVGYQAKKQKTS